MAKLPTAADVRKVTPGSLPNINFNKEAFGSQIAMEQQRLGAVGLDIAVEAKKTGDETSAKNADAFLSKQIRERLFGNAAQKTTGHYGLQGNNALGDREQVETDLNSYVTKSSEGLNSQALKMFQVTAQRRLSTALDGVYRHAGAEQKKVVRSVSVARQNEAENDAAANAGDDSKTSMYIATAAAEAKDRARKEGLLPKEVILAGETATSKGHIAVINAFLKRKQPGDAQKVRAYFQKNKTEIDGVDRATVENDIKNVSAVFLVQDTMDDYLAGNIVIGANGENIRGELDNKIKLTDPKAVKEARDFIRDKFGGDDETAILAELERRITQEKGILTMQKRDAAAAAYKHRFIDKKPLTSFATENPEMFKLIAGDGTLMSSLQRADAQAMFSPKPVGTIYQDLRGNIEELRKTNLDGLRTQLTQPQYNKLVEQQASDKIKQKALQDGTHSIYRRSYSLLKMFGPKQITKPSASNPKRQILVDADTEMTAWIKNYIITNKKIPSEEILKRETLRTWLRIEADPENTGKGFMPRPGEEALPDTIQYGFQDELMSPQQKAVVLVPFKRIPSDTIKMLREGITQHLKRTQPEVFEDFDIGQVEPSILENLAGAFAMRDGERIKRIFREEFPVPE